MAALFLLGVTPARAATTDFTCPPQTSDRGHRFEIGGTFQTLLPSGLPDLNRSQPAYGLLFGIPLFGGTLQMEGALGGTLGLALYLAGVGYRLEIPTPYFTAFALLGINYLHYALAAGTKHGGFGANLGLGIAFLIDRNFELVLSMRTYLQQRSTMSFGVGFSFLI